MWKALGQRLLVLFAVAGIAIGIEEILVLLAIKDRTSAVARSFSCVTDGDPQTCFSFGSALDLAILLLSAGFLLARPRPVGHVLLAAAAALYFAVIVVVWT